MQALRQKGLKTQKRKDETSLVTISHEIHILKKKKVRDIHFIFVLLHSRILLLSTFLPQSRRSVKGLGFLTYHDDPLAWNVDLFMLPGLHDL